MKSRQTVDQILEAAQKELISCLKKTFPKAGYAIYVLDPYGNPIAWAKLTKKDLRK